MSKYSVVDLFSGAGGLSLGFERAGFKIVGAVESVTTFSKTHNYNFPKGNCVNEDMQTLSCDDFEKEIGLKKQLDLIIGGPPCKTFSTIGTAKIQSISNNKIKADPRNYLFKFFFKFIDHFKPSAFLMENVPTIRTKYGGELYQNILNLVDSLGYKHHEIILNSVNFGVPQLRKRWFLVGTRNNLNFSFPDPTHYWIDSKNQSSISNFFNAQNTTLKKAPTVYDAISDLPKIFDGCRENELPYSKYTHLSEYQKLMRKNKQMVRNNICRMSNERAKKVFEYMSQGSQYMDLPKEVRKILPFNEGRFKDRLRRLDFSKPSWTILAHIGMDGYRYIHPIENRTLSVREAARIQSFPDYFVFLGNMREQYIQVGNSVPPLLAQRLAEALQKTLRKNK